MKVCIVGAGIAGLTLADRLSEAGWDVLLLEREGQVGGLARSWRYGPFTFDVGPHRFHTDRAAIESYIVEVLGANVREIDRRSAVFFGGRTYEWPFTSKGLLRLPLRLAWQVVKDLLRRPRASGRSFEDHVVARYGWTLYDLFFRPYTEKFAHESCDALHRSWARVSIQRALIDRSRRMSSLADVVRQFLRPARPALRLLYPAGGCGVFARELAERCERRGGRIVTGVTDARPLVERGRVTAVSFSGHREAVDHLIWTASLPSLVDLLGLAASELAYMDTVFYNLEVRRPLRSPHQWVYYGAPDISFVRVSRPGAFDPANVPAGKDALCVEVTARDPSLLEHPERAVPRVLVDLERVRLARAADIDRVHAEPVRQTYPIYRLDYPSQRALARRAIHAIRGLSVTGRTGAFLYNNMDDSIAMGLAVTRRLLRARGPA